MLHDLFIGFAFIAMVGAPAMVATLGGKKEYQPDPEPEVGPRIVARTAQASAKVIRPHSKLYVPPVRPAAELVEATTLPVRARGMMNR